MLSGMYSATAAINATEQNQEVLARNLAHIHTPGYRRAFVVYETPAGVATDDTFNALVTSAQATTGEIHYDFSQGPLKTTGRTLDVALEGDGFFELEGPEGPLYTRAGVFFVGTGGELVAANGLTVQGEAGPIIIPPNIPPNLIAINHEGTVTAADTAVGKLRTVMFDDPSALELVGEATFAAAGATPQTAAAKLIQGAREGSNVAATTELIQMLVGLRQHEAAQKALQSLSDAVSAQTQGQGA